MLALLSLISHSIMPRKFNVSSNLEHLSSETYMCAMKQGSYWKYLFWGRLHVTDVPIGLLCPCLSVSPSTFWFSDLRPPIDLKFDRMVGHHLG